MFLKAFQSLDFQTSRHMDQNLKKKSDSQIYLTVAFSKDMSERSFYHELRNPNESGSLVCLNLNYGREFLSDPRRLMCGKRTTV